MAFERQIIRREECPRCGALANIRIDDSEEPPPVPGAIMLKLECPKCRLIRQAGITSQKALDLEEQEAKLLWQLKQPKGQQDLKRIRARLRIVQNELERLRLGV